MEITIKQYREQNGLSQEGFGVLIGVSQAAVDRYEKLDRRPRKNIMKKIIEVTRGLVTANSFYPPEPVSKRRPKQNSTADVNNKNA